MKAILRPLSLHILAAGLFTCSVFPQNPGLQRTIVHRADVSVPGREAVITRVEIAPNGRAGRHTHPGDEITYVLEGEGEIGGVKAYGWLARQRPDGGAAVCGKY